MKVILSSVLPPLMLVGCSLVPQGGPADSLTHQFAQSPQAAGACFARNAENHSSALVAEVTAPDAQGRVVVIVRVRNGVPYAKAELRPAGTRSVGTISLNVSSVRGPRQLVETLTDGC